MNDKLYFRVDGGKVGAAIDQFVALRKQQRDARTAFEKEFGAKGTYGNDRGLDGLVFDEGKAPEGWRPVRNVPTVYRPPLGKVGREIKERMQRLPLAGGREFQAMVLGKDDMFRFMTSLTIHYIVFEYVGKHRILVVPKSNKPAVESARHDWQPPDEHCVPLKMSEYWALKEEAA